MNEQKQSRWSVVFATLVRAAAMCLGALAIGWGVTLTEGLGASLGGAIAGANPGRGPRPTPERFGGYHGRLPPGLRHGCKTEVLRIRAGSPSFGT